MVPDTDSDIRPIVATGGSSNAGLWVFLAILAIGGIWLFSALNANRAELQAPATLPSKAVGGGTITAPPPLAMPDSLLQGRLQPRRRLPPILLERSQPLAKAPQAPSQSSGAGPRVLPTTPAAITYPPPPMRTPSVVFDRAFPPQSDAATTANAASANRVTASKFAKPSLTISQGTVIQAVLETALDSNRPGAARALVQRDVRSFDGTRVLIQRGSRLYGEYDSGLQAGQNRALIQWTRLIRPDGVTIALNSPSSDPLGRAGVKGDVDSKFLQRFGGALLQSVLDVGVGLATQEVSDGVILALPGSTQNVSIQDGSNVQRTLKIRHGTSVSVFVARDLDFSSVEF